MTEKVIASARPSRAIFRVDELTAEPVAKKFGV